MALIRLPITSEAGALDTTGRNPGNWTVAFDVASLPSRVQQIEIYKIVIQAGPAGSSFTGWVDGFQWTIAQRGDGNSWSGYLPLQDGQTLYLFWGTGAMPAPEVTVWARYDDQIPANKNTPTPLPPLPTTPIAAHSGWELQQVQVVNNPGVPVITEDGGVPGILSAQNFALDNQTVTLVAAGTNVNGVKIWGASISSIMQDATTQVSDDVLQDSTGVVYLGLEIGCSNSMEVNATSLDTRGITVPAGRAVQIKTGTTGANKHRCSVTVLYTVL